MELNEKRLADRTAELLKGDYSPTKPSNLMEAICEMQEADTNKLALAIQSGSVAVAGTILLRVSTEYWSKHAATQAEADLEKEHHACRCHGAGCDQCNESYRNDL